MWRIHVQVVTEFWMKIDLKNDSEKSSEYYQESTQFVRKNWR